MTCETLEVSVTESPRNAWRQTTPGPAGWSRSARPDDPNKYFMVSADCHATEPASYLRAHRARVPRRIPHLEVRDDGASTRSPRATVRSWSGHPTQCSPRREGDRPALLATRWSPRTRLRNTTGRTIEQRLARPVRRRRRRRAGLPQQGAAVLGDARSRVRRRDVPRVEPLGLRVPRWRRRAGPAAATRPLASIATGDIDCAMRRDALGRRARLRRPVPRQRPRLRAEESGASSSTTIPIFEPIWSLLEETGLPVTFHVSTGRDPRAVGGNGGAIINYVCHSMETTIEPLVQLITSGVFERHPCMQAGLVESGIGFVPWLLETMDHAYRAHHFWVRPVIPELPRTTSGATASRRSRRTTSGCDTPSSTTSSTT